jgi:hypothetical protein
LHDPNPTLPFELLHLRITLPNLLNINSVGAGASTDNVSIPREVKGASNIKAASVMRVDLTKTVFEGAECFFLFFLFEDGNVIFSADNTQARHDGR